LGIPEFAVPTGFIRCSLEENSVFTAWRFPVRPVREIARSALELRRELTRAIDEMAGDSQNTLLLSLQFEIPTGLSAGPRVAVSRHGTCPDGDNSTA
jgi:hypothetical protein